MIDWLIWAAPPQATLDPFGFLGYRIPDHPVWDAARLLTALSTCLLICFYLRIAFGSERPEPPEEQKTIKLGILGYLWIMVPTALTELKEFGEDPLPWRLPMYIMFNIYGWMYVRRRL